MAFKYSFFDPVEIEEGVFDREYNAQEFTDYFSTLVTTGLMKGILNELKVSASGNNMVTSIATGTGFIEGRYFSNTEDFPLIHDTEVLGKDRVDRIVVRLDLNASTRNVYPFIKKGTASVNPVAPTLTQTRDLYEISLAQVKVIGGQTFINASNVVDERGKEVICPYAGSNILPNFDDSSIGKPNGIAQLDAAGKVPASQLNIKDPPDATTAIKGIVKLNNTITSSSTTEAATANTVKQINDKAELAIQEVGSWTPLLGGSVAGNYTKLAGRYIKVGKLVTVFLFMAVKTVPVGSSDYASIGGLPFNATSLIDEYPATIGRITKLTTTALGYDLYPSLSYNSIQFYFLNPENGTFSSIKSKDLILDGAEISMSASYLIN